MSTRQFDVAGTDASFISDNAKGRTVINLSNAATVYLSDAWSVTPGQGYPLTPGMSTVWDTSLLYAITAAGSSVELQVTDVAGVPQTFNLPPAAPVTSEKGTASITYANAQGSIEDTVLQGALSGNLNVLLVLKQMNGVPNATAGIDKLTGNFPVQVLLQPQVSPVTLTLAGATGTAWSAPVQDPDDGLWFVSRTATVSVPPGGYEVDVVWGMIYNDSTENGAQLQLSALAYKAAS